MKNVSGFFCPPIGRLWLILSAALIILSLSACPGASGGTGGGGGFPSSTLSAEYSVFAWNDLGMHCLNPTYDKAVILPPYNTVWVQVVKRGNPPTIETAGLTVEYSMVGNTSSHDKGSYGQFWTNANALFGAVGLADDTGLNLEDPDVHNGLSGTMLLKGDHFQANGIPVVPVGDDGVWNPYQQILITVRNGATIVATTRAMVPTSDEINCAKCHGTGSADSAFTDILSKHDSLSSTTLSSHTPVLCASCHGSPALGTSGSGSSGKYLSQAIHGYHASKAGITCYDCHPGSVSKCSRSIAHTAANGNCTSCHGDMANVASTIGTGGRIPWVNEPTCGSCHTSSSVATLTAVSPLTVSTIAQVDTGAALYRNSAGHGGLACAACHGSPHSMVPSREANDNYQAMQYQGTAVTIGSCQVCHGSSHGGGLSEFFDEHGSSGDGRTSACKVCHTGFSPTASAADAPHQFEWRNR